MSSSSRPVPSTALISRDAEISPLARFVPPVSTAFGQDRRVVVEPSEHRRHTDEVQQISSVEDEMAITGNMISPASVLAMTSGVSSTTELAALMAVVPRSLRWMGRMDRPWGLGDNYLSRSSMHKDLETIRMGKDSWFFRADGIRSYDTLREAFVGERLSGAGSNCGCVSSYGLGAGAINCDAQTEFMREVLTQILLKMPNMDLDALCDDLFGGQRHLCEHYLWWLETEAFVAHPLGEERQDRLPLTDEGCTTLALLELTKPGSNIDMSPKAVHFLRQREGSLENRGKPLFLDTPPSLFKS